MRSWSELGTTAQALPDRGGLRVAERQHDVPASDPSVAAGPAGVSDTRQSIAGLGAVFPAMPQGAAAKAASRYPLLKHKYLTVPPEYLSVLMVLAAHGHTKPATLQNLVTSLEESVVSLEKGVC